MPHTLTRELFFDGLMTLAADGNQQTTSQGYAAWRATREGLPHTLDQFKLCLTWMIENESTPYAMGHFLMYGVPWPQTDDVKEWLHYIPHLAAFAQACGPLLTTQVLDNLPTYGSLSPIILNNLTLHDKILLNISGVSSQRLDMVKCSRSQNNGMIAALLCHIPTVGCIERAQLGFTLKSGFLPHQIPTMAHYQQNEPSFLRGIWLRYGLSESRRLKDQTLSQKQEVLSHIIHYWKELPISAAETDWWQNEGLLMSGMHLSPTSILSELGMSYSNQWGFIYPNDIFYLQALESLESDGIRYGVGVQSKIMQARVDHLHNADTTPLPSDFEL